MAIVPYRTMPKQAEHADYRTSRRFLSCKSGKDTFYPLQYDAWLLTWKLRLGDGHDTTDIDLQEVRGHLTRIRGLTIPLRRQMELVADN